MRFPSSTLVMALIDVPRYLFIAACRTSAFSLSLRASLYRSLSFIPSALSSNLDHSCEKIVSRSQLILFLRIDQRRNTHSPSPYCELKKTYSGKQTISSSQVLF